MINVDKIREDFPILKKTVHGKPLVYFDNAATSQTPQVVIDTIVDYYSNYNANIHRGVHTLSQIATDKCNDKYGFCRCCISVVGRRDEKGRLVRRK